MSTSHVQTTARYDLRCSDASIVASLQSPFKLGPWDHLVLRVIPITMVFVYRSVPLDTKNSELIPIDALQRSLCRLLDYYPHLTGRLHFDPQSNTPEIVALGTGAELLQAHCDTSLDSVSSLSKSGRILTANLPAAGYDLVAPFDPSTEGICRDPIFTVKHTRFSCGGVSLGIRVHHIVCDAQGFFNFMNDLAEIYRCFRSGREPTLRQPPDIRSWLRDLNELSPEQRLAAQDYKSNVYFHKDDHRLPVASTEVEDGPPATNFEIVARTLRFSGSDLAALKTQASDPSGEGWISTTEALSAYLCQRVHIARTEFFRSQRASKDADGYEPQPGFCISIDMRGPDRLNMPTRYFPNCVYSIYSNALHPSMATCALWEVTKSVHDLIRSVDPVTMRKLTHWIAVQPDKTDVKFGFLFGKGSFLVSHWSRMNMYRGNDFDTSIYGKPVWPSLVSPLFSRTSMVNGFGIMLSTEEEVSKGTELGASTSPAVDILMSLAKPVWEILDRDEEFRQYCS